jgi:hypothetical protein
MRKRLSQIKAGDQLMFACQWREVIRVRYGTEMGYLYFSNYPPVIVRAGDTFECKG